MGIPTLVIVGGERWTERYGILKVDKVMELFGFECTSLMKYKKKGKGCDTKWDRSRSLEDRWMCNLCNCPGALGSQQEE